MRYEMLAFVVTYPGHATYRRRLLLERLNPVTSVSEMCVLLELVEFLGQVVSKSGISVDLSKVEAIQNRERPKNGCEVRFNFEDEIPLRRGGCSTLTWIVSISL